MKEYIFEQGSSDWLNWRMSGVGASDASSLMGCGYLTEYQLFQSKMGLYKTPVNYAMQRGHDLEPLARQMYIEQKGIDVEPLCVQSDDYPFMIASLDGISADRKHLIEIKTGGQKTLDIVRSGKVPDGHYAQCQHQLAITKLSKMDYVFFDGVDQVTIIEIKRDDPYINRLIQAEKKFWGKVLKFDAPESTDIDYEEIVDMRHLLAVDRYKKAQEALKIAEDVASHAKKELISLCDGRAMKADGVFIRKQSRKGVIDYSKIEALKNVDLEKYRKAPSEFWTVTLK